MSSAIFVSYARVDQPIVEPVVTLLEQAGRTVWIDRRDIPFSVPWLEEATEAIDAAHLVVMFDTPAWRASGPCQIEEKHADDRGKHVLLIPPYESTADELAGEILEVIARQPPVIADHADLLTRTDEWIANGRSSRYLVGRRLQRAYRRVLLTPGLRTTPEMVDFVGAARARTRRRRVKATLSIIGVLIALTSATEIEKFAEKQNKLAQQAIDASASNALEQDLIDTNIVLALQQQLTASNTLPSSIPTLDALQDVLSVPAPTTVARAPGQHDGLVPAAGGGVWLAGARGERFPVGSRGIGHPSAFVSGRPVATDADGTVVATLDGSRLDVWTRDRTQTFAAVSLSAAALTPDGSELALASGASVTVRSLSGGVPKRMTVPGAISSVAFAGVSVVVGLTDGAVIRLDPQSGRKTVLLAAGGPSSVPALVATDVTGRWLAAARGSVVTLVALRSGTVTATGDAFGDVRQLGFSPDGGSLAAIDQSEAIELWDVSTGVEKAPLRTYDGRVVAFSWSADTGSIWATTSNGHVLGWQFPGSQIVSRPGARFVALTEASSRHVLFAVTDAGVVLRIDPHRLTATHTWKTGVARTYRGVANRSGTSVALLALGSPNAFILDTTTGRTRRLAVEGCDLTAFAYTADGRQIIAACSGGRIEIADPSSGRALTSATIEGQLFTSIAASASRIVVGSYSGRTTVFDATLHETSHISRAPVRVVAVDPSGKRYASIGEGGSRVLQSLLVDDTLHTSGAIYSLRSSDSVATRARALAFSPDGTRLAVGFSDGTVDIIDLISQTTARSFPYAVPGAAMGLAFTPDSKLLLVATDTGVVRALPGSEGFDSRRIVLELVRARLRMYRAADLLGSSSVAGA